MKTAVKTEMELEKRLGSKYQNLKDSLLVKELRNRSLLLPSISIDMSWMLESACSGEGSDIFFPENGAGVNKAREYCVKCSVRRECLEYALLNRIEEGVWGGASQRQRANILRERKMLQEGLQESIQESYVNIKTQLSKSHKLSKRHNAELVRT